MFKILKNQGILKFKLTTNSPLMIKSGAVNEIDPTLPDMQCLRTTFNGKATVFIPGSSLKGVMRSRYEKIVNLLGGKVCNCVDRGNSCSNNKYDNFTAEEVYNMVCEGCKLFGSGVLGSRISFKDGYPVNEPVIGLRTGVGINRITGAAQKGAIYNFEVVEEGTFEEEIILTNFSLYQLKLLAFVLKDIDEGYVALGGSTTRGNGKVKVEDLTFTIRDYRKNQPQCLRGYQDNDNKGKQLQFSKNLYYYESEIKGLDNLIDVLDNVDIKF